MSSAARSIAVRSTVAGSIVVSVLAVLAAFGTVAPASAAGGAITDVTIRDASSTVAAATGVTMYTSFVTPSILTANVDTITLQGPAGMVFPADNNDYSAGPASGGSDVFRPVVVSPQGNEVTIVEPLFIFPDSSNDTSVFVDIRNVTNPPQGTYTLQMWTSQDPTPVSSPAYTITAPVITSGGDGSPTAPSAPLPVRIAGDDRFETAIAASKTEYPVDGTAGAVVLARADDYPDALVGAALAASDNAPLLFVDGGALGPGTQAEIERLLPPGRSVFLLGGVQAIPTSVATTLTGLGYVPVRYAGTDRFGTALAVANALGDPGTVVLATGTNFPDALAAGAAAAHIGGVVLLTDGAAMPTGVSAYLNVHRGRVYAVGGPAVAADRFAVPWTGADRYATAAAVAAAVFPQPTNIGIASGITFADALAGGDFEAHVGGPILLSDPTMLPGPTSAYLVANTAATTRIFGGTAAISIAVETAVQTALGQ